MNQLETQPQEKTMSHIEIADLTGSRVDSVKRTIERLENQILITFTPMVEKSTGGRPSTSYHVNERDSYIVVAQLTLSSVLIWWTVGEH